MPFPEAAEIRMHTVAELSGGHVTFALDRPLKRLVNRSGDRFMAINPWFRYRKTSLLRHFERVTDVNIPTPLFVGVAHEGLLTEDFPPDVVVKRNQSYRCKGVWVFPNRLDQNDLLHDRTWTSLLEELIPEQDTIVIERKLASNAPNDPARPIPFDFKAYVLGPDAEVVQVEVVDRNVSPKAKRAMYDLQANCFLGPDGFDPPVSNPWPVTELEMVYAQIRQAADAAAALTRTHLTLEENMMLRVDMYVVEGKVWLGELTPTPGNLNGDGPQKVSDYLALRYFPNIGRFDDIMKVI